MSGCTQHVLCLTLLTEQPPRRGGNRILVYPGVLQLMLHIDLILTTVRLSSCGTSKTPPGRITIHLIAIRHHFEI